MKYFQKIFKTCIALAMVCSVTLAAGSVSAAAANKKAAPGRPTLTVVTDTKKSNELALRWKTSKKADGYLLKYRRADQKKWTSVWIRGAKQHSYTIKNRKNTEYSIRLKAYAKKKGKYVYSKNHAVTVGNGVINTVAITKVHEEAVQGYTLNTKGKKNVAVSLSRSDLGQWADSAAKGERFVVSYAALGETYPAQISDVHGVVKLN